MRPNGLNYGNGIWYGNTSGTVLACFTGSATPSYPEGAGFQALRAPNFGTPIRMPKRPDLATKFGMESKVESIVFLGG